MSLADLTDTGEQPAVDDTLDQRKLEDLTLTPASQAFVLSYGRWHTSHCWARKQLRRWMLGLAFLCGVSITLQFIGLFAARAMIERTVREVLKEHAAEKEKAKLIDNKSLAVLP